MAEASLTPTMPGVTPLSSLPQSQKAAAAGGMSGIQAGPSDRPGGARSPAQPTPED